MHETLCVFFLGHRLHYKQNNASVKVFIDMEHDETTSELVPCIQI